MIGRYACILAVLGLNGCMALGGTFFEEECNKVYIGTRIDASCITSGGHNIVNAPICLVDLPFSMALDTLFLPYTIPVSLHDCAADRRPQKDASSP